MKIVISLMSFFILWSTPAFAASVDLNCSCEADECSPVRIYLDENENGKTYMKVDFINSSMEGYALVRRYSDKTIYGIGATIVIRNEEDRYSFAGSDRKCDVTN